MNASSRSCTPRAATSPDAAPLPPRAGIIFSESAEKQIEALTDEAALLALERTLAVLSVDPVAGAPILGSHPGLRDYATTSGSSTSSPRCARSWSSPTSRPDPAPLYMHWRCT
ncbi:hypothetical protein GCM10010206_66380 [Streptomyces cinerochromogenes]|nr:hypothetical protein GCM10010206_66380 [Streptomyces cinerochromogenes]